jgi:hypothetical protein
MPIVICVGVADQTHIPVVEIPGVGKLQALKSKIDGAPSPYELAATLIGQASPILAPIIQVLRVIEIVLAIIDTLKAVKSPTKIGRKIKALIKKLAGLSAFIPGLPYVRLVRDILDLVSAILHGFVSLINRWITEINLMQKALFTQSVLVRDEELPTLILCSQEQLAETMTGAINSLGDLATIGNVIARLLEIVKSFIPGNIPQDVVTAFVNIAKIPADLASTRDQMTASKTPAELAGVIVALQATLITIDEAADRLDSISATISGFIP